jgi:DNA polymerase/3'-5' exonuclease PolX
MSSYEDPNGNLIGSFRVLAKHYRENKDMIRTRAYDNVIIKIKEIQQELKDEGGSGEITSISQVPLGDGIGKKSREKIQQYLTFGRIRQVEDILVSQPKPKPKNEREQVIELLNSVWNIADASAQKLYASGIRSIQDLRDHQDLLTKDQRLGLKYYEQLTRVRGGRREQKPIPRDEIRAMKYVIIVILSYEFGCNSFKMEVAGSYRRGNKQSGDMDCLLTSDKFSLRQAVQALTKWGVVVDGTGQRTEKFMGVAHCPSAGKDQGIFRIDIEFLPEDEWGSGLLYFTGSQSYVIRMRTVAKRKGYILNQHGLFHQDGTRVPVYTEAEIVNHLGMKYLPPEARH